MRSKMYACKNSKPQGLEEQLTGFVENRPCLDSSPLSQTHSFAYPSQLMNISVIVVQILVNIFICIRILSLKSSALSQMHSFAHPMIRANIFPRINIWSFCGRKMADPEGLGYFVSIMLCLRLFLRAI